MAADRSIRKGAVYAVAGANSPQAQRMRDEVFDVTEGVARSRRKKTARCPSSRSPGDGAAGVSTSRLSVADPRSTQG